MQVLYAMQVYSATGSQGMFAALKSILKFFAGGAVVWALPLIAAGAWAMWRRSRSILLMILTWLAVALACVAAQRKFYKYHWVLAFPPMTALGAAGFEEARNVIAKKAGMRRTAAAAAVLLGAVAVGQLAQEPFFGVSRWLKLMMGRISADQYYASHRAGALSAGDSIRAADYIRRGTVPADRVAVYGDDAEINFLSGRANPTRFLYSFPLAEGGRSPLRAAFRREYMLGLTRNPPAYLVVGPQWGSLSKKAALNDFPELEDLLGREYSLETRIGALDLYRRHEDGRRSN